MAASTSCSGDTGRLAGVQAAIVTGSSSGIGRGIALAFAEAGVGLVVCADLQPVPKIVDSAAWEVAPEETSRATHEVIAARHGTGRAVFVRCDVSVERVGELLAGEVVGVEGPRVGEKVWGMADLVAETVRRAGRLDVMVNNAGVGILDIPLHEMDYATWNKSFSINATGPFLGSKHAVTQFLMQEPDTHGFRGTIVNISSIGGTVGLMRCSAYCASKASIIGLARETAIEYGDKGIRSNVICPGYIATPMLQPFVSASPEFAAYLNAGIPAGRLGKPADVAGAAVWLASGRESGYVTGVVLPVDGGFTAR